MRFEWDSRKDALNLERHRISFQEASTAFDDPLSIPFFDPDHSDDEDRFILMGASSRGTLLMVAHTYHGERVRIISARLMSREERVRYEAGAN